MGIEDGSVRDIAIISVNKPVMFRFEIEDNSFGKTAILSRRIVQEEFKNLYTGMVGRRYYRRKVTHARLRRILRHRCGNQRTAAR